MPAPDYLVRAALAWARNNGKLDRIPGAAALLSDMRPVPDTPTDLWHSTPEVIVRASVSSLGRRLILEFRYDDMAVTHEFKLPREFGEVAA